MIPYSKDFPYMGESCIEMRSCFVLAMLEPRVLGKALFAITRGGGLPAAILCRKWNIRLIYTICYCQLWR